MRLRWQVPGLAALLALGGCASEAPQAAAYGALAQSAPALEAAAADTPRFLAYEHHAGIELPAAQLAQRLEQARLACVEGRHGACEVLQLGQNGGDRPSAQLVVRIVPEGVEPLIAEAAQEGRIGHRSTHAEDLAVLVADNMRARERLQREQARLEEFRQRRDLAVSDMIALAQQLAQVEAQLQGLEQEAAQHERRIRTQKLTLEFRVPSLESGGGEIGQALRDFVSILVTGTAWTIRAVAFAIPALLLLWLVLALRRWRRRRCG